MNLDFTTLRLNMVNNQLRTVDVVSPAILSAFLSLSREDFVPVELKEIAYIDDDLLLSGVKGSVDARYLMEPAPLAKLLQLCNFSEDDRVLHIGANIGYASIIISDLVRHVVALESDSNLVNELRKNVEKYKKINIEVVESRLNDGYDENGPYDVIFIEGSVQDFDHKIFDQLCEGGRLIIVEGASYNGVAKIYNKQAGDVSGRVAFNLNVKPLNSFSIYNESF